MDMRTYLRNSTEQERERLARAVGSSVGYFWQIAGGHRKPSTSFSRRLVEADPRLTLEELRPDVWGAAVTCA